jgi:uncharacterized protein DUF6916
MSRRARADGDQVLVSRDDSLPKLTRRHLLVAGSASGAAAMAALNPRIAAAADAITGDPLYLRRASYTGLVGERFVVDSWGSSSVLTLVSVSDIGAGDLAGRDDAFSLTFSGDPALALGNDAIPLRNGKLGRFQLFVGRVDPAPEAHFEAIVNRSVGVDRRKAPTPESSGKPPTPAPHPATTVLKHVSTRRTSHGVRFEIELAKRSHARRAHGWLMKGKRLVGAFDSVAVHDHRFVAKVRTARRLPRGTYELFVAAGGQAATIETVRVKLR